MKLCRCSPLLAILMFVSCHYPNEFKNAPANVPHAVLIGTKYPNTGHVFATHINGQPTSFWRNSDAFRISPGTNTCHFAYSDRRETLGYRAVPFIAVSGRSYVVARKQNPTIASPLTATPHPTTSNAWIIHDRRDCVIISEITSGGSPRIVADTPKEDYVFGVASPDLAIAEYRKKNL